MAAWQFPEDFRLLDLKCQQSANWQILEADHTSREYAEQISGMLSSHHTNEPAQPQLGEEEGEQEDEVGRPLTDW